MRRYEGMFLFDSGAVSEWGAAQQEINRLFERIGARPLVTVKYDERKLAYEIKRRKRGLYALSYFEADPQRIGDLERDARLSETVLRVLVLSAPGLTDERINELRAIPADQPVAPLLTDARRHGEGRGEGDEREGRGEGGEGERPHRRRRFRDDEPRDGAEPQAHEPPAEELSQER